MELKKLIICPNCKNEFDVASNYCPNCGQVNKKLNLNFKFIVSEFLSANFNLDNKIILTLKELIIHPSKLTSEFMVGRRAKYISPIRLYLFISFVYFFVLSMDFGRDDDLVKMDSNDITTSSSKSIQKLDAFDLNLNDSIAVDSVSEDELYSGFEESLQAKAKTINTESGKQMFKELLRKYSSIGMFVLIPIMALLLFWIFNRGTYYFQHLVFSFHLQSVIFLLFILFNIIGWFTQIEFVSYIEWILLMVILFSWLKKYYKRSIKGTIWKMLLFLSGYLIVIILFFLIVVFVSFLNLEGLKS